MMATKRSGKAYYMISAVAQKYNIHPQTLRLYEREGLLKPSRTEGNTRLYSEEDLEQLETILSLTRDLGVNLAGVEIILNMFVLPCRSLWRKYRGSSPVGSVFCVTSRSLPAHTCLYMTLPLSTVTHGLMNAVSPLGPRSIRRSPLSS